MDHGSCFVGKVVTNKVMLWALIDGWLVVFYIYGCVCGSPCSLVPCPQIVPFILFYLPDFNVFWDHPHTMWGFSPLLFWLYLIKFFFGYLSCSCPYFILPHNLQLVWFRGHDADTTVAVVVEIAKPLQF